MLDYDALPGVFLVKIVRDVEITGQYGNMRWPHSIKR